MEFNERVQTAIKRQGITHSEAARKIGTMVGVRKFSPQHIARLVAPGSKGSSYVLQIARALHVNPYWLATGEGDIEPDSGYENLEQLLTTDSARKLVSCIRENEYRLSQQVIEAVVTLIEASVHQKSKPNLAPPIKEFSESASK